jgi:hypothetical protein
MDVLSMMVLALLPVAMFFGGKAAIKAWLKRQEGALPPLPDVPDEPWVEVKRRRMRWELKGGGVVFATVVAMKRDTPHGEERKLNVLRDPRITNTDLDGSLVFQAFIAWKHGGAVPKMYETWEEHLIEEEDVAKKKPKKEKEKAES